MSWLFSQALVAEYSRATCSAGEPFAPSSGNPTPLAYLQPDRTTAFSRLSRSGATFAPLTDDLGVGLLTWFQAASRARTSALPAKVPASTERAAECGPTWRGSLARFDPASCTWRTAQRSLLGDLEESSVIWPRSGMTAGGQCWELPTLAPPTSATGSGLWVPTPIATEWKAGCGKLWPTPNAGDAKQTGNVENWDRRKAEKAAAGINLQEPLAVAAARMRRTPSAMVTEPKSSVVKLTGRKPTDPQVGLADQVGGKLNPTWVEWLMGWPIGWTDLKPLATDKCPAVPPQPGACSLAA